MSYVGVQGSEEMHVGKRNSNSSMRVYEEARFGWAVWQYEKPKVLMEEVTMWGMVEGHDWMGKFDTQMEIEEKEKLGENSYLKMEDFTTLIDNIDIED